MQDKTVFALPSLSFPSLVGTNSPIFLHQNKAAHLHTLVGTKRERFFSRPRRRIFKILHLTPSLFPNPPLSGARWCLLSESFKVRRRHLVAVGNNASLFGLALKYTSLLLVPDHAIEIFSIYQRLLPRPSSPVSWCWRPLPHHAHETGRNPFRY